MSSNEDVRPRKSCTVKRRHRRHAWWSRQHKRYFICGGRR